MASYSHDYVNYLLFFGFRDSAARIVRRISCFIEASSLRVGTRFNCSFRAFSSGVFTVTLLDITSAFDSGDRCRELLERLRWPNGPECSRCHTHELARLSAKLFYCKECDYQFTVTSGTIFHDSHLPL